MNRGWIKIPYSVEMRGDGSGEMIREDTLSVHKEEQSPPCRLRKRSHNTLKLFKLPKVGVIEKRVLETFQFSRLL